MKTLVAKLNFALTTTAFVLALLAPPTSGVIRSGSGDLLGATTWGGSANEGSLFSYTFAGN